MWTVRNGCTMKGSTPFCTLCRISLPLSAKNYVYFSWSEQRSCQVHAQVCCCDAKLSWWQLISFRVHIPSLRKDAATTKTPFRSSANLELLHEHLEASKLPWMNHFLLLADLPESPGCNQVLVISVNLTYYCNLRLLDMSVLVIKIIRHEKLKNVSLLPTS